MGAGRNDCDVSRSRDIAEGSGEEGHADAVEAARQEPADGPLPDVGDVPCFTEAELKALLPPIPAWMRKGPRPKSAQQELFERG